MRAAPRSSSGPRRLSGRGPGFAGAPVPLLGGGWGGRTRAARARDLFAQFLVGTPIEGDAGELDRLMRVGGTLARMQVVSVIRAGEADSVAGALANLRWRRNYYRDVRDDINSL